MRKVFILLRQTDRLVNRQLLSRQLKSTENVPRHNARYYVAIATEKYGICLISIYFSMLLQTVNLVLWLNYQTQSNKVITVTLPTSNTSFAFHFTIISILQYIVVQGTFFDHLPFTNKVYFIYFISSSQTSKKSYQPQWGQN